MSSQVEKKAKVADEQQQATTAEKEEEELIKREEREREAVDIHRERMAAISILSQLEKLAPEQPLKTADIHGVADYVVKNNIKNIIVMW